jgi:hypothetical protein
MSHLTSQLFESLVSRTKVENGCWVWQGAKFWDGYGQKMLSIEGKKVNRRVHRLVYEILWGAPKNHVCHRCDNPACINPAHLFNGTRSENMRDMHAKGRGKKLNQCARGSSFCRSKLKEQDILDILNLKENGESCKSIGRRYSMGKTAIQRICRGDAWKHVMRPSGKLPEVKARLKGHCE